MPVRVRHSGWVWASVWLLAVSCRCAPKATVDASSAWLEGRVVEETSAPLDGGTLRLRLPNEPKGLTRFHDRFADGNVSRFLMGNVYETLGRVDATAPNGALLPSLATSWAEDEQHQVLTVQLRSDVKFHDGAVMTANDVKATIAAVLNPDNETSAARSSLGEVASVEVLGPLELRVTWRAPTALGVRALLASVPVLPAKRFEGAFDSLLVHRAPDGTGPFRFVSWVSGDSIVLKRFEGHWSGRAHLDRVVLSFIEDDAKAVAMLERGELDFITRLSPAQYRALERPEATWARTKTLRLRTKDNAYSWVGWNERRAPFDDVRVRRALGMAFPAAAVSRLIDLGLEPRASCPYAADTPSCDPSVQVPAENPAAAGALLDEAQWRDSDGDGVRDRAGQKLVVRFLIVSGSPKMTKLVPLFQEALKPLGVEVMTDVVDAPTFMARMKAGDFDAAGMAWASADARIDAFGQFHSSQIDAGLNYVGFHDVQVDAWLEQLRLPLGDSARFELERQVQRRVVEQQAYLFLSVRPLLEVASTRVHGLQPWAGPYDLRRVWLSP